MSEAGQADLRKCVCVSVAYVARLFIRSLRKMQRENVVL